MVGQNPQVVLTLTFSSGSTLHAPIPGDPQGCTAEDNPEFVLLQTTPHGWLYGCECCTYILLLYIFIFFQCKFFLCCPDWSGTCSAVQADPCQHAYVVSCTLDSSQGSTHRATGVVFNFCVLHLKEVLLLNPMPTK